MTLICDLPHHQEEPAEIDTDGVPDAGKGGHDETEEADHDVRDEDQLVRCGCGLDVRLVDVEGYCMLSVAGRHAMAHRIGLTHR